MTRTANRRRPSRRPAPTSVAKPRGVLHPRVQRVGPEHFGIVCFDCAKARSKLLLADFYGRVLIPPTTIAHTRPALDAAVAQVRQAFAAHQLRDGLVAIERTGRYHRLVQRTFAAAGFETRILHPFVTKQFRQPVDPGHKTDDTDLSAIHRATVTGCALLEATRDEAWTTLQLVIRHRRDLVEKGAALNCQIRDHLEAALPGYAACFDQLWESALPWHLLRHFSSAAQLRAAGLTSLGQSLRQAGIRFQQRTVQAVLDWAEQAAPGDIAAPQHQRLALALYDDRLRKTQEIQALEREIAGRLARTPYVLLLSCPGINVVSAADFAGEMGPIEHYANAKCLTGRAGLRPSRYQSDQVDHANGPLVRKCNRALRAAILRVAENLIVCNHHFQHLARQWTGQGKDARHTRVKVGLRFCRIAFQLVAGRQVFRHPCIQGRHYILDKLTAFHREHESPMPDVLRDLQAAVGQVPPREHAAEAQPLQEELQRIQDGRRRGPQPLSGILPLVLARLGVGAVQSTESGE
ncbi:MAG: transposase [Planctomycetia bacterium]|nr:transposase [Planctomycetia bacterium]